MNKQSRTTDKGSALVGGLGEGLRAPPYKKESLLRNVTENLRLERTFWKGKQRKINTISDAVLTETFKAE
jgi:hypothetical protein